MGRRQGLTLRIADVPLVGGRNFFQQEQQHNFFAVSRIDTASRIGRSVVLRTGSLSRQSFGLQAFQILTQRDLLLLVLSQRAIRWTECIVGIIFALAHDVSLLNRRLDRKRSERFGWRLAGRRRPATTAGIAQISHRFK